VPFVLKSIPEWKCPGLSSPNVADNESGISRGAINDAGFSMTDESSSTIDTRTDRKIITFEIIPNWIQIYTSRP